MHVRYLRNLCVLLLLTSTGIVSAQDDVSKLLGIVLAQESFQDLLHEYQGSKRSVCLVTNGLMKEPLDQVGSDWTVGSGSTDVQGGVPCINVQSFTRKRRKMVLQFQYDDYQIKVKAKHAMDGDAWQKTSFTLRGKGKMIVDKEF